MPLRRPTHVLWLALLTAIVGLTVGSAQASLSPQQKLMAKRAAELDAYRKLAERIMGLEISSETSVRDFVTESDAIATHVETFIKGVRFTDTRYYDDGTAEVDAAVTIQQVVEELKRTHDEVYDGRRWKKEHFEEITRRTERKVIEVTGAGAARAESGLDAPADAPIIERSTRRTQPTALPPIYRDYPPAERLKARRAAELDAYRKLVERIYGLEIASDTFVRDFVTESDAIEAATQAKLKGARTVDVRYAPDGVVEVEMAVTIQQVVETVKRVHDEVYDGRRWKKDHFDEIQRRTERRVITVLGTGALDTERYDRREPTGGGTTRISDDVIIVE
ncbi:MAG: hypothetical protein AAGK09_09905 [Planctomycetota bacterium]